MIQQKVHALAEHLKTLPVSQQAKTSRLGSYPTPIIHAVRKSTARWFLACA